MSKGNWFGCVLLVCALTTGCLERDLVPLNPCLVSGVARSVDVATIDKLDLLFVVDNSVSMAEEQAALNLQFPKLIKALTSGVRSDGTKFPAVKNLHLGVVSSDMGLAGIPNPHGCDVNGGDDGVLQHKGGGPGCSASYPSFLSFELGSSDPDKVANDFGCIASLGTLGCGFEQQLEAGLKALWPKSYTDKDGNVLIGEKNPFSFLSTTTEGRWGHGDSLSTQGGNAGFLRNDVREGISLIAVVVVTDEEDCSSIDTSHFTSDRTKPVSQQPLNLRCFLNKQNLFKVERYVQGFKALRPGQDDLVIFAAIAGVPEDLVSAEARARYDFDKDEEREAYYEAILSDPRMQERQNDATEPNKANLVPSCYGEKAPDGKDAAAYPPVRIVQVARAFGKNGVVQSICQKDFGPAMDAIIKAIADAIPSVCLPKPLVRDSDGSVRCNVVWELPEAGTAGTGAPTDCAGPDTWLSPADPNPAKPTARKRCVVRQLAVKGHTAPEGQGWYYDDFSEDVRKTCEGQTQRVSFTESAKPGNGVIVKLECLNETQSLRSTDTRRMPGQPEIGAACAGLVDPTGTPIPVAEACAVDLRDGSQDRSMFCHPELNVCVRACQGSAQCPPAWVCDTRSESMAKAGGTGFCMNPTCGSD